MVAFANLNNQALTLNEACYCWPVERGDIVQTIIPQTPDVDMQALLSERLHYFANTGSFISTTLLFEMTEQIQAIEEVIKLPTYREAVRRQNKNYADHDDRVNENGQGHTAGAFMGYDFHITEEGPRLIEINSNAGGAFIVNMIETALEASDGAFDKAVADMFRSEWRAAGRRTRLKTIAIIDTKPSEQYHYPDMCLAKALLERQGFHVVIDDPSAFTLKDGRLYHADGVIDLIYNRLTDFSLTEPDNRVIKEAYLGNAAVVTPALHHHALFADKRNLITLSNEGLLKDLGATQRQLDALKTIPKTRRVTPDNADDIWASRKGLFFKPQDGFGSRGAFRGAKLTKKVWGEILEGGYIAQTRVVPPMRAVTVEGEKTSLKFDVRVYTYEGKPLLLAARIYQGQTTNLRTVGGGLAVVKPIRTMLDCA